MALAKPVWECCLHTLTAIITANISRHDTMSMSNIMWEKHYNKNTANTRARQVCRPGFRTMRMGYMKVNYRLFLHSLALNMI